MRNAFNFGFDVTQLTPEELRNFLLDASMEPFSLLRLHPPGRGWTGWKKDCLQPGLASEVATNLARAAHIRELISAALTATLPLLTDPANLKVNRLLERTDEGLVVGKPRIDLFADISARGDLCVYVEPSVDDERLAESGNSLAVTDFVSWPHMNAAGRPGSVVLTIPAQLTRVKRAKAGTPELVASQEEIARAVVCGLDELAQNLAQVCEVFVFDWVVHYNGKYRLMAAETRLNLLMQAAREKVYGYMQAERSFIDKDLHNAGLTRRRDRDEAIKRALAAGVPTTCTLTQALPEIAGIENLHILQGRFERMQRHAQYVAALLQLNEDVQRVGAEVDQEMAPGATPA